MNRSFHLATNLLLSICSFSCNSGEPPAQPAARAGSTIAFTGVNVIPMDTDRVLQDRTVLVVDSRITSVADSSETDIPAGAQRIDATGRYLIPALSDMHIHLEGAAWNVMFPPEVQFQAEALDFERLLYPYVANGVATVQVMSALPEHIELREQPAGEYLGGKKNLWSHDRWPMDRKKCSPQTPRGACRHLPGRSAVVGEGS